ncbi:ATPase family associated with various cellular activities (AAA) [Azospirillum lipoferum]|nr:ATP-binding protein [Azospirillum agricola]SMH43324.1 ATPase family associated with various cellular activities (AAA) [Azospirillum lipoferum]
MSTKHILALLNSHIDGDEDQVLSIALQIAAQEARQGRPEEAEKLKRLVQKARDQRRGGKPVGGQTPIPLARPRGELQGLVESTYPKVVLSSMVLADSVDKRLTRIVRQQQERATLREHGQTPATHMLLVGPPGTGKTMTASALAGELRLPLFTVRLESLFSRFFGETAGKLRLLFDQIAQTRGVSSRRVRRDRRPPGRPQRCGRDPSRAEFRSGFHGRAELDRQPCAGGNQPCRDSGRGSGSAL